jgi:hypothetical protein
MIPPITDPLGASWKQPKRENILIDGTHAVMSVGDFNSLLEYSSSIPSGVYPGKMWRRNDGLLDRQYLANGRVPVWLLCWYAESKRHDIILLVEGGTK